MKKIVFIFCAITVICGCKTISKQKLPHFTKHLGALSIYDPTENEVFKLNNLKSLSYSTTYSMIHGKFDSIQKDSIRFALAKFSKSKVKSELPQIKILNDSLLLNKNYNEIMFNTTMIKWHSKTSNIKNLLIKDNNSKQLFIEIKNYPNSKNNLNSSINFLIFDNKKYILLYYDTFEYKCDIRDFEGLDKVLEYGFKKLTKNFE